MSDSQTTVADLKTMVRNFVDARDWQQFHAPKNISMAMAVEVAELMEHFQWMPVEQSRQIGQNPDKLDAVGEELADVVCYALALANELNLDVSHIMRKKMQKNEVKYPAETFRGKYET